LIYPLKEKPATPDYNAWALYPYENLLEHRLVVGQNDYKAGAGIEPA